MRRSVSPALECRVSGVATYSPISPSPGILGRLSVLSSGGNRNPAQEQSIRDDKMRKMAAARLIWKYPMAEIFLDLASIAPVADFASGPHRPVRSPVL